ncbi:carbon-nitrogen family hydrolase [Acetomicrobium sp. S15 = DSM 107314]|uniref:carbon-nitrogen family hydrolase n=1 Tax=Acetomicrobium sp. S15 = DSM 107314 TaxID=2529858 RepID=UPI0018E18262|nr:carbon-nitrogen family hydrolase [Acetomicrobium sp. S15 = DSM 107314]
MKVGIVQLDVKLGKPAENFKKVAQMLEGESAKGVLPQALVLPELWSTGYALERADELASPEGIESAHFLGELAKRYGMWFVGGSVLAKTTGGFANRAQVINPKGELVAIYDKIHLIRLMEEDKYFIRGKKRCLFDLDNIKAACVICYDIRFPELARRLALEGAKILFVSSEWPKERIEHWRILLLARAIENQMYVVACNRCGSSAGTTFGGHSMIIDPWGSILYEAGEEEAFGTAEIDIAKVDEVRRFLPVFEDRLPEAY